MPFLLPGFWQKRRSTGNIMNMIKSWFKQYGNLVLIVLMMIGLTGFLTGGLLLILELNKELPQTNREVLYFNQLTGFGQNAKMSVNPIAVMVENATEIRPQFGLGAASVVYEALVEGGITRFMAVYDYRDQVEKIGPVRSARPYFLDWAAEYQPAFFHVGGSPQALEAINGYSIIDINEMGVNEIYFSRGSRQEWPHNVYTGASLWQDISDLKNRQITFKSWRFKPAEEIYCPPAGQKIIIDFSYGNYQVRWDYDCITGRYLRINGGSEHLDEAGRQLTSEKVIIQFVKSWLIDTERLGLQTVGQGKAIIFQNGRVAEGGWQKAAEGSRTEFLNTTGETVEFLPGKTWIEVVPPLTNISY